MSDEIAKAAARVVDAYPTLSWILSRAIHEALQQQMGMVPPNPFPLPEEAAQ